MYVVQRELFLMGFVAESKQYRVNIDATTGSSDQKNRFSLLRRVVVL